VSAPTIHCVQLLGIVRVIFVGITVSDYLIRNFTCRESKQLLYWILLTVLWVVCHKHIMLTLHAEYRQKHSVCVTSVPRK